MSVYPPKSDAPPPYGVNPPPQVQVQPIAVVMGPSLGPNPCNTQCPSCHAQIQTRVEFESSTKTHIIALLLCLVGCWPCACIPYCTDDCKSSTHHCPSCGAYIGTYKK